MMKFFKKHWEVLSYLIFGVLTTLLNILLYALFSRLFGYTAANSWGNVLDNALCILFAYCTNRAFVFRSKTTGKAMAKEFGTFVTCRLGTMVLDAAIMIVGGNLLAAQGAALMETPCRVCWAPWPAGWVRIRPSTWQQLCRQPCRRWQMAPLPLPSSAVQTAPQPSSSPAAYNAQAMWGLAVKVFSNVLVILLNYVFSKLIIFKKETNNFQEVRYYETWSERVRIPGFRSGAGHHWCNGIGDCDCTERCGHGKGAPCQQVK